ncbi:MAG: glycerate kinase [Actinobacteria bacterium]|nr:MAG: glycerate kinase [Actinomycetota bacterium]
MKILVAPDKFKGTLDSKSVAKSIITGIKEVNPDLETILCPIADGGDDTINVVLANKTGRKMLTNVTGPLNKPLGSYFAIFTERDKKVGLIEMAAASGLSLVPERKRNPLKTTTFGTGELIKTALNSNCRKIIIGLGGSATCDGGTGMAQALGVRFLDKRGKTVGLGGKSLLDIHTIDIGNLDKRIKSRKIIAACDVDNPLYGPRGAAKVYAGQKGAGVVQINQLEQGLVHLSNLIKEQLGIDVSQLEGGGAAGGLGAGLVAFLQAKIVPGFEVVSKLIDLKNKIKKADLIITGEGKLDEQSLSGKAPIALAKMALSLDKPVGFIVGQLGEGWQKARKYAIKIISLASLVEGANMASLEIGGNMNLGQLRGKIATENAAKFIKMASHELIKDIL